MTTKLAPIDDSVQMPKAVREAAKKIEEFYAPKQPDQPAQPETNTASQKEPPKEPAAEVQAEPAELKMPAELPAAETPEPPAPKPTVNYEHLYRSWKGRYDAEVPRMKQQIAALEEALRAKPATSETSDVRGERLITDEDIKDYGPDLLDVVGKKAKEEFNPVVTQLRAEINDLKAKLRGVGTEVVQSARERLHSTLDQQVPNWQALDENQRFIDWLQLPDQYSGVIRHELLNAAYERNDAPRTVAFFKGFLAEEAASVPANAEPHFATAAPVAVVEKVPLESLAAPGRAKSTAAANAPVEKPIITRAQIARLYADKARNRYVGREAEFNRMERMIEDAQRDGRIQ